jgi:transposase-like protein
MIRTAELGIQKYSKVTNMSQTDSNHVCEFIGCNSTVSDIIEVKVGHLGLISLYLCKDCKTKFEDKFGVN